MVSLPLTRYTFSDNPLDFTSSFGQPNSVSTLTVWFLDRHATFVGVHVHAAKLSDVCFLPEDPQCTVVVHKL